MIFDFTDDPTVISTEETWWAEALELKTALVNCKMRLFKSGEVAVNQGTTAADLEAAECDYDGYAEVTIAATGDPMRDTDGTVLLNIAATQFNYVDDVTHTANDVGGAWIEDASGDVRKILPLPEAVTLEDDEDGLVIHYAFRIGVGEEA